MKNNYLSIIKSILLPTIFFTGFTACKKVDTVGLAAEKLSDFVLLKIQDSLTSNSQLRCGAFVSADTGWAAGSNGKIIKTINGGATWDTLSSGTTNTLLGLHFIDSKTGWFVSSTGMIKKTTDGGTTWLSQTSGATADLKDIYFADASNGICVGNSNVVLTTNNGGITWVKKTTPLAATTNLLSVHCINTQTAYACGASGSLVKTNDGGNTWSAVATGVTVSLNAIHFPKGHEQYGFIAGSSGQVLKVDTATTNPTPVTVSDLTAAFGLTRSLQGIKFLNEKIGYAMGSDATALQTADGGKTWILLNMNPVAYTMYDAVFVSDKVAYLFGNRCILKKG